MDEGQRQKLAARLLGRIATGSQDDCWLWQGPTNEKGYGKTSVPKAYDPRGGRMRYAHRVAWEVANKELLEPTDVIMHKCDTPGCCNPFHLEKGDLMLNRLDTVAKGRAHGRPKNGKKSKLTHEQALQAKAMLRYASKQTVANAFGKHWQTISDLAAGKTWRHVQVPDRHELHQGARQFAGSRA